MLGALETAGELVAIECEPRWVAELLAEGSGGELVANAPGEASVRVCIESSRTAFHDAGWQLLTRGAWRRGNAVVVENACTAGFDVRVSCTRESAEFVYRWRPPTRERVAARALRSRFHLLARAVLMQYPALWWAGTRGRAPLHVSACATGDATPLVAAASGVGRSTLLLQELEDGGRSTGDNLAVGDGTTVWGLVEPLRVKGGSGRRMPHGRNELEMRGRAESLVPDSVVVLERGVGDEGSLVGCSAEAAARSLITSTYMAGELRRYWAFAETLAAGTAVGPAEPGVAQVASAFAAGLPCFVLALGRKRGASLSQMLQSTVAESWV